MVLIVIGMLSTCGLEANETSRWNCPPGNGKCQSRAWMSGLLKKTAARLTFQGGSCVVKGWVKFSWAEVYGHCHCMSQSPRLALPRWAPGPGCVDVLIGDHLAGPLVSPIPWYECLQTKPQDAWDPEFWVSKRRNVWRGHRGWFVQVSSPQGRYRAQEVGRPEMQQEQPLDQTKGNPPGTAAGEPLGWPFNVDGLEWLQSWRLTANSFQVLYVFYLK